MNIGIRQFTEQDALPFHQAVLESVAHVSKWLPWCSEAYSLDDAKMWTSSARTCWDNGTDYRFVIEDKDSSRILGSVGINHVDTQHKVGNLGYWVRTSALNQGVCTEAATLVADKAFKDLGFQRLEVHVLTENAGSNAVAQKIGGIHEGALRNKLMLNGVSLPANCYSLIPSDYGY